MAKSSVLVIEDDASERELLAEAMKVDGYEVMDAGTCAEARELIHAQRFDLILLDLILPDSTDLDFLREVKDECPDTAVIMVTAEKDDALSVRALKSGAYDYITKPFSVEELAMVVNRALDHQSFKRKTAYQEMIIDSMRKLVDIIEAKDSYVESHAMGVAELATLLAKNMELDEPEISEIRMAALMHDLGKIGIPEEILNKKGKLTEKEMLEIKKHPELSVELVRQFLTQPMIETVKHHHERWDGSGYPDGLEGEDIPLGARVIAIADVYHAMTSDRPYRKKLSPEKVIRFIEKSKGVLFDPEIVERFIKILRDHKAKI